MNHGRPRLVNLFAVPPRSPWPIAIPATADVGCPTRSVFEARPLCCFKKESQAQNRDRPHQGAPAVFQDKNLPRHPPGGKPAADAGKPMAILRAPACQKGKSPPWFACRHLAASGPMMVAQARAARPSGMCGSGWRQPLPRQGQPLPSCNRCKAAALCLKGFQEFIELLLATTNKNPFPRLGRHLKPGPRTGNCCCEIGIVGWATRSFAVCPRGRKKKINPSGCDPRGQKSQSTLVRVASAVASEFCPPP